MTLLLLRPMRRYWLLLPLPALWLRLLVLVLVMLQGSPHQQSP